MVKYLGFLLLLAIAAHCISAQTRTCGLSLEVERAQDDQESKSSSRLLGAEARLFLLPSRVETKSETRDEMPFFADVSEGKYQLWVSKKGFRTTSTDIDLNCGTANEKGEVAEIVLMWKGDPKETARMDKTPPEPRGTSSAAADKRSTGGYPILKVNPVYPRGLRGVTGTVAVQVIVNEFGVVTAAVAIRGDSRLTAAAEEAARKWKFSPMIVDGQAVQFTRRFVFNFTSR